MLNVIALFLAAISNQITISIRRLTDFKSETMDLAIVAILSAHPSHIAFCITLNRDAWCTSITLSMPLSELQVLARKITSREINNV